MKLFKTGRKAQCHSARTMRGAIAMARALDPLGVPPIVCDNYVKAVDSATGGDWGMMGNGPDPDNPPQAPGGAGNCTFADGAHQIMLHTANAGTIVIPTTAQTDEAYSACTGYDPAQTDVNGNNPTDQGANEAEVCAFMQSVGIAGHKSAGSGPIDPANIAHIKWAIQLFGACRFGIYVDETLEDQFNAGEPWTVPAQEQDGHDVPAVYYDADYVYVVTWKKLQPVAWALAAQRAFLTEAHGEVYLDWVKQTAPAGFLAALLADLPAVA